MKKLWLRAQCVWGIFWSVVLVPVAILADTAVAFWDSTHWSCRMSWRLIVEISKVFVSGQEPPTVEIG